MIKTKITAIPETESPRYLSLLPSSFAMYMWDAVRRCLVDSADFSFDFQYTELILAMHFNFNPLGCDPDSLQYLELS